jgi:hypothetical protein
MTPSCTGDGLDDLVGLGDAVELDFALVVVGLRTTSTQYELPILIPLQSDFTEGFCDGLVTCVGSQSAWCEAGEGK